MPPRPRPASQPDPGRSAPPSALFALCLLAWSCAWLTSCASHSAKRTAKSAEQPAAVPVPVETRVGVVRAIGAGERFVLIETFSALATSALSEGQLLHCRPPDAADGTPAADLRVSRERHQALIVANVVAGEPAVGAIAYSAREPTPADAPSPGSISSVSTAPLPGLFPPPKP